ncbi:MAG TPA: PAS domain S-box protein [Solirubrobacter sp.]|nr:PAS domain S-box protein [Solirubrobacter sp.]
MSGADKHERARERTIELMADSIRRGDWLDALQWLNTLAAVDLEFSLTADQVLASWRDRASRFRRGDPQPEPRLHEAPADYRGLFAALLEHAYDGIVISDAKGGWMLECSRSFATLTGYAREELLGRTSEELGLIDPELRAQALAAVQETRGAGGFETPMRRKDGTMRRVEFSTQLLPGDELLLSIVRDVTDRRTP